MSSFRHARSGFAKLNRKLPLIAGLAAFFYTTIRNDISYANANNTWGNFTGTQKAQTALNWFVSRLSFGLVPRVFGGGTFGGVTPTFQLQNIVNPVTGAGVLAYILGHLGVSRAKRFTWPLIAAGVAGGLLDDPAPRGSSGSVSVTSSAGNAAASRAGSQAVSVTTR